MKKTLDQHFTPAKITRTLVDSIICRFDPLLVRTYIEPAVGEGAFLTSLLEAGVRRNRIITIDVDPTMKPDVVCDFLEWSPREDDYIVIGNPPFGRGGALAWKFKEHATSFAPVCGFIMPLSAVKRRHDFVASLDIRFETTTAKSCWMEWYGHTLPRLDTSHPEPPIEGIEFVDKGDVWDLVIQRCGSKLGQVTACNGTGEGKYYIKAKENILRAVEDISKYLEYAPEAFLTSQQPSLSRILVLRLTQIAFFRQNCS
jgi:hypothetical protein